MQDLLSVGNPITYHRNKFDRKIKRRKEKHSYIVVNAVNTLDKFASVWCFSNKKNSDTRKAPIYYRH